MKDNSYLANGVWYPRKAYVAPGWEHEYKLLTVLAPPVMVGGIAWAMVIAPWLPDTNDGEDPTTFKESGLVYLLERG